MDSIAYTCITAKLISSTGKLNISNEGSWILKSLFIYVGVNMCENNYV